MHDLLSGAGPFSFMFISALSRDKLSGLLFELLRLILDIRDSIPHSLLAAQTENSITVIASGMSEYSLGVVQILFIRDFKLD